MNKPNQYYLIALFSAWLLVHLFLFRHYGIRNLLDASEYLKRADYLLIHGALEEPRHVFYIVFLGLITFFHWLSPGSTIPFLVFQSAVSGLATIALYYSAAKCFNNYLAGFLSGIIFLVWLDNIHWNIILMTESLLCSVTCFLMYCLVSFEGRRMDICRITALTIIIIFIRPTGVIIVMGVIAFLTQYYWKMLCDRPALKFTLLITLACISCIGAYCMFTLWDFTDQYVRGNVITFVDVIQKDSPFYSDALRINTDDLNIAPKNNHPVYKMVYFIYHNPAHFFKASVLKVWYLISFVRPYYSGIHNLFSIIWVSLIYIAFYFGLQNIRHKTIVFFAITVMVINCALIAISTADWDNRFYIPMEPGIVLIAGGGVTFFFNRLKAKYTSRS